MRKVKVNETKVSAVEKVDTSKFTSLELVEAALCEHKNVYVAKTQFFDKINQSKKDIAGSYRDQLKDIKDEMNEMMANITALEAHRTLINASENAGLDTETVVSSEALPVFDN